MERFAFIIHPEIKCCSQIPFSQRMPASWREPVGIAAHQGIHIKGVRSLQGTEAEDGSSAVLTSKQMMDAGARCIDKIKSARKVTARC